MVWPSEREPWGIRNPVTNTICCQPRPLFSAIQVDRQTDSTAFVQKSRQRTVLQLVCHRFLSCLFFKKHYLTFWDYNVVVSFIPFPLLPQALPYTPPCSLSNLWPHFLLIAITYIHMCVYTYIYVFLYIHICILRYINTTCSVCVILFAYMLWGLTI